jgi:K+-sensing histidine kinase KdpD
LRRHDELINHASVRSWQSVRVVAAVAAPVVVVVGLVPVRSHIDSANLALGLVVVVLAIAYLGGRVSGAVSALSAAVAFDFFLTRPFGSLRIYASRDLQTTVLLVVIGVIAGELVDRARRSGAAAATKQAEIDAIYRRAELAAGTDEPGRLVGITVQELTQLLDLKSCRYVSGPPARAMPELTHFSVRVPANLDPEVRGLMALPVRAHGRLHGHVVMSFPTAMASTSLTSDQRHAAIALADQLGVGLLRFHDR